MSEKLPWLRELANFAGILVGIVMVAIGTVMFLNAGLKFYVFGFETNSYFNAENMCNERVDPAYAGEERTKVLAKMTEAEKEAKVEKCITRETEAAKKGYARQQKESLVEGLVSIIVGSILWFAHRRRKKGKKA